MNHLETFKISVKELLSNKMRAGLTMLGIIFGVAAVIAMMSIGEGAKQETLQQIELMGTNNIIIKKTIPSEINSNEKKVSFSKGLTLDDARSIVELNPMVEYITPQLDMRTPVIFKSQIVESNIIGTTSDYLRTYNSKILHGSFFKSFHSDSYSNVCVIGSGIKNQYFKFEDPLKAKIKIGDLWFNIIGVIAPKNVSASGTESLGLRNFNNDIYIPISTMMNKMEKEMQTPDSQNRRNREEAANVIDRKSVDQLTIKVKNSDQLKEAAYLVKRIMERRHNGVKDFELILPEQLLEQKQKTQKIFNIVMGAIAGISLLVGGIGIMNIMLANIMERTREIGVRRAVGATKLDVLNQFIYEAVTISVLGGLFGIIIGFLLTSLISTYAEWNTIISPFSVVLAFVVSVATGLVFGIYPAKQAAEKNPIESLRYE